MDNDGAVTPTPAGAVTQGEPVGSVATQTLAPASSQATSSVPGYPNMVFNIGGTTPTTPSQNNQSANIGSGTPAAKSLEGENGKNGLSTNTPAGDGSSGEGKDVQRPESKLQRVERKDGKVVLTQERLNSIIAEEVDRARKAAEDAARAQVEAADRAAQEAAADTVEKVRALWQEDKSTMSRMMEEINTLKSQITGLQQEVLTRQAETEGYQVLIDSSMDRKVEAWPERVRSLDPKVKAGENYTADLVGSRMQWMNDMEPIVAMLLEQEALAQKAAAAPVQAQAQVETPQPPKPGNAPDPEPVGDAGELDAAAFLEQERARFRQTFNGKSFL